MPVSAARVDEKRRLDLAIAVLARVQIEHEVDQRAREPRAAAEQHRKPRARHARRALEVENAERRAELPVRLRRERERAAACPTSGLRRCRPTTSPPARSRAADSAASAARVAPLLDLAELGLELLDPAARALCSPRRSRSGPRPAFFARATASPAAFCSRFRFSTSGISRRRSASSAASSASSFDGSIPRARSRASTSWQVIPHVAGIEHPVMLWPEDRGDRTEERRYDPADEVTRAQSRLPRGRARHPVPAGHQGAAEGDAAARRQADHPVRRRGGRRVGRRSTSSSSPAAARTRSRITSTSSVELETFLESRGKTDLLEEIRQISSLINVAYVRQGEPLGLGHAVLVTRDLVGDEPFAVILADDVIDATPPALAQMMPSSTKWAAR